MKKLALDCFSAVGLLACWMLDFGLELFPQNWKDPKMLLLPITGILLVIGGTVFFVAGILIGTLQPDDSGNV